MSKHRAGLQKQIPAIFDGVPIPKKDDTQQPSGAPTPQRPDYASRKPPVPSYFTATIPRPGEPAPLQPKAAPAKQPKAAAVVKTTGQRQWQQSLQQIQGKLFSPKPGVNAARQKAMAVLVPVLFIVFIFVFVKVFSAPSHKPRQPRRAWLTKAVAASGDKIDWQIPALWSRTLRDPMQFGVTAAGQGGTSRLIVKGIVYSDDKPTAVIGTQIVHEGGKVSGATVVKINEDSIEFEMNGKRWTQKVQ